MPQVDEDEDQMASFLSPVTRHDVPAESSCTLRGHSIAYSQSILRLQTNNQRLCFEADLSPAGVRVITCSRQRFEEENARRMRLQSAMPYIPI